MALKPLLSFSSGELDPVLTDNVTLEKFNKGLATARNVMIGKTGSILSRFSRYHLALAKNPDEEIKIYCPPNTDYVLEWGPLYVRVWNLSIDEFGSAPLLQFYVERVTTISAIYIPDLHFVTSKDHVYAFVGGQEMMKLSLAFAASDFVTPSEIFEIPDVLLPMAVSSLGAGTGYPVEYLATLVINNEESLSVDTTLIAPFYWPKPVAAGDSNTITVSWPTAIENGDGVSEVRIYTRPYGGGGWGFLGVTTKIVTSGANQEATFIDIGSLPDYGNGVQDIITKFGLSGADIIDLFPKTGTVYQQRLLLGNFPDDEEGILASRPGFQNNFYRDFPYAADSALQFKAGTSGKAKVLRMIDSDGLIVFTSNGVYINSGLLNVGNLALDKKGAWIINEALPPLIVPGGVFFVDKSNTIRQLIFSQDILAYESVEQTIFSNHLFKNRTIVSWAFQDGLTPLIIVAFSDGKWATFTYNFEHQMRAWTRHDSSYDVEQVEGTTSVDRTYFVTNKDGQRSIEVSLPRRVPVAVQVNNSESDKLAPNFFMDAIKSYSLCLNTLFSTGENYIITPVTLGDWEGNLILTTNHLRDISSYVVGTVFRVFDPEDGSEIDLTVESVTDLYTVVVSTSTEEFPPELSTTARLYATYTTLTGLDHLEGELVSVIADGALVSSPNDQEVYTGLVVTGGELTLPGGLRGAIIHVGRPITADVKTLNVSTLEQSPTLIESINCNKVYVRVHETRGLYCSNKFPEEANGLVDQGSVIGMEDLDEAQVPVTDVITGNRYLPNVSKRIEKSLPGSWESQGQISLRQVDPFHFEILSIIPDIEVLKRSDR